MTFYVTELLHDGLYTMTELASIEIPKSVQTLETLVSRRSLSFLLLVAHAFDKIKREEENTSIDFQSMKRIGPTLQQLEDLVSEKRNRKRRSTVRY